MYVKLGNCLTDDSEIWHLFFDGGLYDIHDAVAIAVVPPNPNWILLHGIH